jgi:hypothetical protein
MTRAPLAQRVTLTTAVLLGLALGWIVVNKYIVRRPYAEYLEPARAFLNAALRSDSARLDSMSADPSVLSWGLDTGRRNPALLRALLHGLGVSHGRRAGTSTLVLFGSSDFGSCRTAPLTLTFQGPPTRLLVADVLVGCVPVR